MLKNWNKVAIGYRDKLYTYSELLQHTQCYAEKFVATGKPEKVAIFAENSPEWIFAFYGAFKSDAVVVPIDILSTPKEIAYILEDCRPDIVFTTSSKRETLEKALALQNQCKCQILTKEDIDTTNYDSLPVEEVPLHDLEATALIIYTSGTTGSPKGVMLSRKNIVFNVNSVSQSVPIFSKDRNVMILLPLHHAFPLMGSMVAPLYVGSTVYIADGMTADSVLNTLNKGKIGIIIGVPRLYDMLAKGVMAQINSKQILKIIYKIVNVLNSQAVSNLVFKSVHKKFGGHIDYLVSGGAALSDATATVFKTLGFYVLEGYGMTETAPMISFTRPGERKIGYVGRPLPNIEVKISEDEEICVKGDNVMQGYYHREAETADIIRDGWLHTGDRGFINKYGIKITGRLKEIIVTPNGKNINPEELELEMMAFSKAFKEVGVFMHDDILQAVILPEMTELRDKYIENMDKVLKELIADFNQTQPSYKRIKQIHITSSELPKTRLGKVQRFKLASIINEPERKEEEEETPKSKTYLTLKQYIDAETGMKARANDHFEIDLSMDSLSRIALAAFVQTTFGVNVLEEELDHLNTLALLSKHIEESQQDNQHKIANISWKSILMEKLPDIKLPKPGIVQFLTGAICEFLIRLCYRYRSKGKENIPDKPCIIIANHRSALDGVLITSQMKPKVARKTYFFAKAKHWKSRFAQFMARKNNVILMDINKNLTEALQQMSSALQKGKNVIIFPEGTRSKNAKLNEFKDTFAILSRTLNVPILPVTIEGSEKAFYKHIAIPRFKTKINVNFLQPIYPNVNKSAKSLKEKVVRLYTDILENGKK